MHLHDVLESRRLLAVTLHPDGLVEIDGNNRAERLHVRISRGDLVVKLFREAPPELIAIGRTDPITVASKRFDADDVTAIDIDMRAGDDAVVMQRMILPYDITFYGRRGNDSFELDMTGVAEPSSVWAIGDGGDDRIAISGPFGVRIDGSEGDDQLSGTSGNDAIDGGDDADTVLGLGGVDVLRGGPGDDRIDSGGAPFDELTPVPEEQIDGGPGRDLISGGDGRQLINGGSGNDTVSGGANADRIFGDDGEDILRGDGGNDLIHGDGGNDELSGGNGNDRLFGGNDGDAINGNAGDDQLAGDRDNDTLAGNDGNDTLAGGTENDLLSGGNGDDILDGDDGNDAVLGDAGSDALLGGSGIDHFNRDERTEILDFSSEDGVI